MFDSFFRACLPSSLSRRNRRPGRATGRRLSGHSIPLSLECLEERLVLDFTGTVGSGVPLEIAQASLPVHYMIAMQGIYPSRNNITSGAGEDPILGEVRLFAGTTVPQGWEFCDGQLLSISQYTALFSILGTSFGGDGRSTFALPDLQGRVAVGADSDPMGFSPGDLGQAQGAETDTLNFTQVPSHNAPLPSGGSTGYSFGQSLPIGLNMPSRDINYIIALQGIASDLGEIRLFAGTFAPAGWTFCEGQTLPITQNSALFNAIGAAFGGDGVTTFALPNLDGKIPVGADPNSLVSSKLSVVGAQHGAPSTILTVAQLPAHTYPLPTGGNTGSIGQGDPIDITEPSLAIHYIIALSGDFQSTGNNQPAIGQISPFVGTNVPAGWALCGGQALSISQDQALFSVLGINYGGNGFETFDVPNMQGRAAVEAGQGPGLPLHSLGAVYGSDSVSLQVANLPPEELALPNVIVTVAADQASVNAGGTAGFTVTITNNGSGTVAGGLTLSDPLPDLGGGQTWSINNIAKKTNPDDFQIVTVQGTQTLVLSSKESSLSGVSSISVDVVGITAPGAAPFSALLTSQAVVDTPDESVRSQKSVSVSITVLSPDVTMANSADAAKIFIGATAGFSVTLTNFGLSQASGLTFSDALSALGSDNLWSIDPTSLNASDFALAGPLGNQVLTLSGASTLAPGDTLVVHVTGITAAISTLTSIAIASAGNEAAALQNQQASASITVAETPTTVSSISRVGNGIVYPGSDTVSWTVSFADPVGGLTANDFVLISDGLGGSPTITAVTSDGAEPATVWTVSASTGTGDGTLQLNLTSDAGLDRAVSNLPSTGDVISFDRNPPTAVNDSYSLAESQSLTVAVASGVLLNDSAGYAGDSLTAAVVTNPANGSLTLNSDGSFSYIPNGGFFGADSFTYQDQDITNGTTSNLATVTLTVSQAFAPFITAPTYTNITSTTAVLGGDVAGIGGSAITKTGVLFAPTANNPSLTLGGKGVIEVDNATVSTGVFAVNVAGLTPSTRYSFVAFATNSLGTSYTSTASFATAQPPSASLIYGPTSGSPGQQLTYTLSARDPAPGMQANYFTFHIKWGDGKTSTVSALNGATTSHTYSSTGTYVIQVSATDGDSNILPTGTLSVTISNPSTSVPSVLVTAPNDSRTPTVVGGAATNSTMGGKAAELRFGGTLSNYDDASAALSTLLADLANGNSTEASLLDATTFDDFAVAIDSLFA